MDPGKVGHLIIGSRSHGTLVLFLIDSDRLVLIGLLLTKHCIVLRIKNATAEPQFYSTKPLLEVLASVEAWFPGIKSQSAPASSLFKRQKPYSSLLRLTLLLFPCL